eukprot:TRINITY_DN8702_c0_g1_i1.p1 TRINITY_DN8702_c0_g1~~TRINITY_DN8702_c0_g1_i1.p1  ORF type:complete len:186 (+),score=5.10 TRINITY_DN8702_c0_g1_i1:255-812(+)
MVDFGRVIRLKPGWAFLGCLVVGFVLGLIGVIAFAIEADKDDWVQTVCTVNDHVTVYDECRREQCHGSTDNRYCSTYYEPCWKYYWDVEYTVESASGGNFTGSGYVRYATIYGGQSSNRYSAENRLQSRPIGSRDECWYDPITQSGDKGISWFAPDTTFGIVFMSIGWPIFFIGAVGCAVIILMG